ncbi:MAG: NADH-quinone oxidoreductase subunit L [Ardenticatenales bacterium]
MTIETLLPVVLALPLLGFVVLAFFGRRLGGRRSGIVATATVGAAFAAALWIAALALPVMLAPHEAPQASSKPASDSAGVTTLGHGVDPASAVYRTTLWNWMTVAPEYALTVATRPIPAGQPVTADAVAVVNVPVARVLHDLDLSSTARRMFSPEQAVGRIARVDFYPPPPYGIAPLTGDRVMGDTTLETDGSVVPVGLPATPLGFVVDIALQLDALSLLMILVITGVGFLIHLYSTGYMAHDPDRPRYFAYLNLFVFSMLTLVLGANFLVLFVGWELVGACSYLLIGFWHKDDVNASAGRKAFIVNRIGDVAFLIAMMLIFTTFATLSYASIFPAAAMQLTLGGGAATAIAALLLIGATGKSAQVPLYVWLPDAMAGPTPVSALIHAATMVTAGVYMIARAHALFERAPAVLAAVAVVGAVTALGAALIALVQRDIKRVLAYSTVSQLGYMFMGVGAGAYAAGVFHLMTHAFFKALLFLGAGSLMHAMEHGFHHGGDEAFGHGDAHTDAHGDALGDTHGHANRDAHATASTHAAPPPEDGIPPEQDLRRMGGLVRRAPITGWTVVIGGLALAGVFPLAGFWSKDEILHAVLSRSVEGGGLWVVLYAVGLLTAGLTAFYTGRLLLMALFGAPRSDGAAHAAESPRSMTAPLVVLAVLSAVGGLPALHALGSPLATALGPVLGEHASEGGPSALTLAVVASAVVAAGLGLAWAMYGRATPLVEPARMTDAAPALYRTLLGKFYVDELYDRVIVRPFKWLADRLWHDVDDGVIDGAVNGVGRAAVALGQASRRWQTGYVRSYGLSILIGAAALAAWLLWLV